MEITVSKVDGVDILGISGKLDNSNAYDCEVRVTELIDSGCRHLVFDLKELKYISSAGLRIMLVAIRMMESKSGKLSVFGMNDHIKEVFSICGMDQRIDFFETRQEALNV